MNAELHRRASEIFLAVRELDEETQRTRVRERCGEDEELVAAVFSLLDGSERVVDLTSAVGREVAATVAPPPERIGGFEIVRELGRGGMGRVYLAEQTDPRRTVALKVLRPELATTALLRRFEHEKQILGRLRHRGIAQIFDAGCEETRHGPRPWFAMELVEGRSLVQHANERGLDVRRRLELAVRVCDAVEYAHRQGVIHRDLKSSNVLVDHDGEPKVLDFGVARLTDADVQAMTMLTEVGQIVGTFGTMSPEQASGDPDAVDTRTDVYSLGALLYRLLSGRDPYEIGNKSLAEVVRAIQEDEPARLGTVDRELRGDVETIVAKALEKDRERRYGSAAELADDLRRFLAFEPIEARPPSRVYRLSRFVRRHQGLSFGMVATFLALLLGLLRAQSKQREAEEARDGARREASKARAINRFLLLDLLASPDPQREGRDARVVDVLRRAEQRIGGAFDEEPEVAAAVLDTLGMTYQALGLSAEAEPHVRRGLELRESALGDDHLETLTSREHLASVLSSAGRHDEALPIAESVRSARTVLLGADAEETLSARAAVARQRYAMGEREVAVAEMREVVEAHERVLGGEDPATLSHRGSFSVMLAGIGRLKESLEVVQSVRESRRRVLGEDHPDTLLARSNLVQALLDLGRPVEAEEEARAILDVYLRVYGEDHPITTVPTQRLAGALERQNRYDEAERLFRAAVELGRDRLGENHRKTLQAMEDLSRFLWQRRRFEESEALGRRVHELVRAKFGESSLDAAHAAVNLANCVSEHAKRTGDLKPVVECVEFYRDAIDIYHAHYEGAHPRLANALFGLTVVLTMLDRPGDAIPVFEELIPMDRELQGPESALVGGDLQVLGSCHYAVGDAAAAVPLLEEAYRLQKKSYGEVDQTALATGTELGQALAALGRFEEAEPLILGAYDHWTATKAEPFRIDRAREKLVELYEEWGKPDRAAEFRAIEP